MCCGTHTTFLQCFVEERNKVLTLSCEGIIDVEGYALVLLPELQKTKGTVKYVVALGT